MDARSGAGVRDHRHLSGISQEQNWFLGDSCPSRSRGSWLYPFSVYTLSTWYIGPELAKRLAILFFGMFGGNAISPLLGAGILRLDGRHGLKGCQWIFLGTLCKFYY